MHADVVTSIDEFTPASSKELSRFTAENARGARQPVIPVGGRTSLNYGCPVSGETRLVSSAQLCEPVDYPARDMTITVGAGIRMDRLRELLKAEGQQLPIDVSQSQRATLGGVAATNTSGPRRFGYGTLRDYVIGLSAVDAGGRLFRSGGRVVKNVAGYDLCKLLVGSLGTLAIITELTLKLKPLPETSSLVWVAVEKLSAIEEMLQRLTTSAARPVILEALNPAAARHVAGEAKLTLTGDGPVLIVGVEGSQNDVGWQVDALRRELESARPAAINVVRDKQADQLMKSLTEYQVLADDPLTFHANVRPSRTIAFVEQATQAGIAIQAHAGNGIVIGHLSDASATVDRAAEILAPLRALAQAGGGNLVILNCEPDWKRKLPVFGAPPPSWDLMRRVKTQLDPHDLLSPGRLFGQ